MLLCWFSKRRKKYTQKGQEEEKNAADMTAVYYVICSVVRRTP